MRGNIEKFVFLGVMIFSTFFASYQTRGNASLATLSNSGSDPGFSLAAATGSNLISDEVSGGVIFGDRKAENKVSDFAEKDSTANSEIPVIDPKTQSLLNDADSLIGKSKPTSVLSGEGGVGMEPGSVSKSKNLTSVGQSELGSGLAGLGFVRVGGGDPSSVQSQEVLVGDLLTSKIYFSLNSDRRWPLASITKLMTAVVAMSGPDLTKPITITEKNFSYSDSSDSGLDTGDTFTILDLARKMLMSSSNVAAEAFAYNFGRDSFIEAMNSQAIKWGMFDSNFKDPTGISVSNQATAFDIQKLVKHIYAEYPEIFKITRKQSITITEQNTSNKVKVASNNEFAGRADFLGGKTGYTDEARGNLVSIFSYSGRPILIVVLGSEDRFGETSRLYEWFRSNYVYKG